MKTDYRVGGKKKKKDEKIFFLSLYLECIKFSVSNVI